MKIRIILLTIIALTSIVILFLPLTINPKIIEKLNSENYNYPYTKAICDGENFCQDYEIICEGNKTIQKNPITGASIQHEDDWNDPRDKNIIEKDCIIK